MNEKLDYSNSQYPYGRAF